MLPVFVTLMLVPVSVIAFKVKIATASVKLILPLVLLVPVKLVKALVSPNDVPVTDAAVNSPPLITPAV